MEMHPLADTEAMEIGEARHLAVPRGTVHGDTALEQETRQVSAVLAGDPEYEGDVRGHRQRTSPMRATSRMGATTPPLETPPLSSASARTSDSTISRTSSGKLTLWRQPSLARALAGSPTKRSTSVGRK